MSDERINVLVDIMECASYLMKSPDCDEKTLALFCRCIRNHTKEYYRLSTGKDWKDSEYVEVTVGKGYDGRTVQTSARNDEPEEEENGSEIENVSSQETSNKNQRTFLDDLFEGTIDTLNTMMEGTENLYSKWKENHND